jgi:hypothetical protein
MANGYNTYIIANITHHQIAKYTHHCIAYTRLISVISAVVITSTFTARVWSFRKEKEYT